MKSLLQETLPCLAVPGKLQADQSFPAPIWLFPG
jgi:hypothetical protein